MAAAGQEATINFDQVVDGVVVGSCLRGPADAERARQAGVVAVLSLQDEIDLANQGLDGGAVAAACQAAGVRHLRCPTSDADEQQLRQALPAAVAALAREVAAARAAGGSAYVHCNGGRGRAPTVATAYLYWATGLDLSAAAAAMTSARNSQPKLPVIVGATADLLSEAPADLKERLSDAERAAIQARLDAL